MDRKQMNTKMADLLEEVEGTSSENNYPTFTEKAVGIVKEIAAWARETDFYKRQAAQAAEFWTEESTVEEIWMFMLRKIVGAPTAIHRDCVIAGHMSALEAAIMQRSIKND